MKQQARLAPQLLGRHRAAHRMGHRAFARMVACGGFQARQPVAADAIDGLHQAGRHRGAVFCGQQAELVPKRQQPEAALLRRPECGGPAGRARGDKSIAVVGRLELQPDTAQLVDVVRRIERLERQRAQQPHRRHPGKALVLGQQARCLQRLLRMTPEPRGLQPQPQCMRAARNALRQLTKQLKRTRCVAVVERPLSSE